MKSCAAVFYLIPSLGIAYDYSDISQDIDTLLISKENLRRVNEQIIEEYNRDLQKAQEDFRDVLELSRAFNQILKEQGFSLDKTEENIEQVDESLVYTVAQLEYASDLVLARDNTISTLQHVIAGGASLVCGGAVAGISAVFAPVSIAIGTGVAIGAITFGGTEIGLHKDEIAAWFCDKIDDVEFPRLALFFKPETPKEHNVRLLINGVDIAIPKTD